MMENVSLVTMAMPVRFVTNEVVTCRADILPFCFFTWISVHVILCVSLVCVVRGGRRVVRAHAHTHQERTQNSEYFTVEGHLTHYK